MASPLSRARGHTPSDMRRDPTAPRRSDTGWGVRFPPGRRANPPALAAGRATTAASSPGVKAGSALRPRRESDVGVRGRDPGGFRGRKAAEPPPSRDLPPAAWIDELGAQVRPRYMRV